MSLTKFVFIVPETNEKGTELLRRLDTDEVIERSNIQILKRAPIILELKPFNRLPDYIEMKRGFKEKSNALLAGEKIKGLTVDYQSASYCKI